MYYIQAAASGGWTMYRAAGITRHFDSLKAAKMIARDMGYMLIVLDRNGARMN